MVIFYARDKHSRLAKCVIDLDRTSEPSQILVVLTEPQGTLAATLASIEDILRLRQPRRGFKGLDLSTVMLIPDLSWRIKHRFVELEGRPFLNAGFKGQQIDVAEQDTLFRLHRTGAELKSEAKIVTLGVGTDYVFDRPFLICLRKRGSERPYFVMWVDNAELLERFRKPWWRIWERRLLTAKRRLRTAPACGELS